MSQDIPSSRIQVFYLISIFLSGPSHFSKNITQQQKPLFFGIKPSTVISKTTEYKCKRKKSIVLHRLLNQFHKQLLYASNENEILKAAHLRRLSSRKQLPPASKGLARSYLPLVSFLTAETCLPLIITTASKKTGT